MKAARWMVIAGVASAVTLGGVAVARAQGHGRGMFARMMRMHIEEALDDIDATQAQRDLVHAEADKIRGIFEGRRKEHRGEHQRLLQALTADTFDAKALYDAADTRAQEIRDLSRQIVPELQKVHDALTPAQRKKLADRMAKRAERMRRMHDEADER